MRGGFRCSLQTGLPGSLWILCARLAWLAITTLTTSCAEDAYFNFRYLDNAHCGKKFRIATHVSPPYIMIQDWSKCVDQKCGAEAFGNNGGVVYKLMMEHILPQLRTYCKENDFSEAVDFEWYLPPVVTDITSSEVALQMVCQGHFHSSFIGPLTKERPICPSGAEYKGPSPADAIATSTNKPKCDGAYHPNNIGCVSSGPDLVVGAVHLTGRNLDMLDFTVPYMVAEQLVVTRNVDTSIIGLFMEGRIDAVFTILLPFTLDAWIAILIEIGVAIVLVLIYESSVIKRINYLCCTPGKDEDKQSAKESQQEGEEGEKTGDINHTIMGGFHGIYDSFFWAVSMMFHRTASNKYPITPSGQLYIVGHCLFALIIAASYRATVGPAIMRSGLKPIKDFHTLSSGHYSVAVVGPRLNPNTSHNSPQFYLGNFMGTAISGPVWNPKNISGKVSASVLPFYLGNFKGTAISDSTLFVPESLQFNMLQTEMRINPGATFSIITAESMHSLDMFAKPFIHTKDRDPCQESGVKLGIYDLVRCKYGPFHKNVTTAKDPFGHIIAPDSTIHDAPMVVFELMQRYNNTGSCPLVAKGSRFGTSTYGIGFPKNTSLPHIFSRAIERVKFKGLIDQLMREARLYDMDNDCRLNEEKLHEAGLNIPFPLLSGLYIVVVGIIFFSLLCSSFMRLCNFSLSTLSDEKLRRTSERNAHRGKSEAGLASVESPKSGRNGRMKEIPVLQEKSEQEIARLQMYKPYSRPKLQLLESLSTKQTLEEIFDTCERFEDNLHAIVRNAGQAHSKARTILIDKEKKKRSKIADKPSSTRPSSSDSETTQQAQEPAMADFVRSFSTNKTKVFSAHLAEVQQKRDTYT